MELLQKWAKRGLEVLNATVGGGATFTQDQAMALLSMPQTNVANLISRLETAGYILKERDNIDQRMRVYRLVSAESLAVAERLNQQLEAWQHQVEREPPVLADAIDHLWAIVKQGTLPDKIDLSDALMQPGSMTLKIAAGQAKQSELKLAKAVKMEHLDKKEAGLAGEVLKLFDTSSNGYRSITNVLLYFKKLEAEWAEGEYTLAVGDYVMIDGLPLKSVKPIPNKSLCPICRRFKQTHHAMALISGNPKMDSAFQVHHGTSKSQRSNMSICAYCFLSGYVDLPAALVTKAGQGVNKGREYLFITTPLGQDTLKELLHFITASQPVLEAPTEQANESAETEALTDEIVEGSDLSDLEEGTQERLTVIENNEEVEEEITDNPEIEQFEQFLQGIGAEAYDQLAVLGLSRKRLRELRGFVLPGAGGLSRVLAVRVPVERLFDKQDSKVSGAVRRELIKATMFDFWQITGGSLHYNRIIDATFSVDGQAVEWEDMYRANIAYRIADRRYARIGKYRQLNSGLFMLLLWQPRVAANRILHRAGAQDFPPKLAQTQEIINMTERIASTDWKFDLGLKIIEALIALGLTKRAQGFWYVDRQSGKFKPYKGYELSKWIQRIKMMRDPASARAWGTSLINGYRREHNDDGPNAELVEQIIILVEEIITICQQHNVPLGEFSRQIANMDYYLLFYYNQRQANQLSEGEPK